MKTNLKQEVIDKVLFKKLPSETKKTVICIIMVTISTIIYCLGVMWFLDPAKLYSGGVTGIAQLISNLFDITLDIELPVGIIVFLLNIPIVIFGWKYVSKRFVICSLISIGIQTIMMSGIIPHVDFGINTGLNPITGDFIRGSGTTMDLLLLSFIGGFVSGTGSALALRYGTSTGGVDIIAQAVAIKKHISIGYISLFVNVTIAILGAIMFGNPAVVFYTIVRIISQSVVTDKIHTAYNFLKIEIVTNKSEEISTVLIHEIGRGITVVNALGAYSHTEKTILETVVSSYEVSRVIEFAKQVDPHVFVTVSPVKFVVGNFRKKTIA